MATTVQQHTAIEWNEAHFNSALARLQEMHIQLRRLRNTIPSLIEPMVEPHNTPESLYTTFSHAATTAAKNIRVFTDLMEDPESKALLDKAKMRKMESSEAILPWRITQHEGWLYNDRAVLAAKDPEEAMDHLIPDDSGADREGKDPVETLEAFRQEHPTITADMDGKANIIKIVLPPPARMKFIIKLDLDSNEQTTFPISCSQSSHLHSAILRCLSTRPRPNDLRFLLEMLAAYSDVKSRPCVACGKLLDGKPQLPVIRRRKSNDSNSNGGHIWDALHETCA